MPEGRRNKITLARIEGAILSLLLCTMIVLACGQILLRTLFSSGMPWADPVLRYLVLWSGLLGAAMATSQGKHISIDIISFLVPKSMQTWLQVATNLFSAIIAAFLTWGAYLFIRNEMQFSNTRILSVPTWVWNLIFPIAFALISSRFLHTAWTKAMSILSQRTIQNKA